MKDKIIYLDVDDTVADTRIAIVNYYRNLTGDHSTDFLMKTGTPSFEPLCPKWTGERMREAFMDPEFFKLLRPLPGARAGVERLIAMGYDVKFCTAHRPEGEDLKIKWCRAWFPMVKDIIITRPFEGKDDYVGHAFIDDSIHNLVNNKSKIRILFDIYEIFDPTFDVIRVTTWERVEEVLQCQSEFISSMEQWAQASH